MRHIPFDKLPPNIQEEITLYLQTDNFQAAKNLRDKYEAYFRKVMRLKSPFSSQTKITWKSQLVSGTSSKS